MALVRRPGRLTLELYRFSNEHDVRRALAWAIRRLRFGNDPVLTQEEVVLYLLWKLGGFRRDALAIGMWAEKGWPVVRRGDGTWVTIDPATLEVHDMRIYRNLSTGVDQRTVH